MSWLSSFFAPEFEGRALQRTGKLTREQYEQFFAFGTELFSNLEFKRALSAVRRSAGQRRALEGGGGEDPRQPPTLGRTSTPWDERRTRTVDWRAP